MKFSSKVVLFFIFLMYLSIGLLGGYVGARIAGFLANTNF